MKVLEALALLAGCLVTVKWIVWGIHYVRHREYRQFDTVPLTDERKAYLLAEQRRQIR